LRDQPAVGSNGEVTDSGVGGAEYLLESGKKKEDEKEERKKKDCHMGMAKTTKDVPSTVRRETAF
jgi:hypothetical protein